jgi:hypothetical protein
MLDRNLVLFAGPVIDNGQCLCGHVIYLSLLQLHIATFFLDHRPAPVNSISPT